MRRTLFQITGVLILLLAVACDNTTGTQNETPRIEITSPQNGSFIYGVITIKINVLNPDDSDLSEIVVKVNDLIVETITEAPYEVEINTNDYSNGEITISAEVKGVEELSKVESEVIIDNEFGNILGSWEYKTSTNRFYIEDVLVDSESIDMTVLGTVYNFLESGDLNLYVGIIDTTIYTKFEVVDGKLKIGTNSDSQSQAIEWASANHFNLILDNGEYLEDGVRKREESVHELFRQ